jgi:hypothetical protein
MSCWACLALVIIPVAGPVHLGGGGTVLSAAQGRKSISQSMSTHLIKGNKGSGNLVPPAVSGLYSMSRKAA